MASTVFYQGSLQEAIGASIQQGLFFAALVSDDGPESKKWDDEYMNDEELKGLLKTQTILFRIAYPGVDAANLYAFCPQPPSFPHFVLIKAGQVLENCWGPLELEQFKERTKKAIESAPMVELSAPDLESTSTEPSAPLRTENYQAPPPTSSHSVPAAPPLQPSSSIGSSTTAESDVKQGKRRQETPEEKHRKQEQIRREAHLAEKQRKDASQLGYLEEQKKRKKDAESEKERIRGLLEADKAERKARGQKEREERARLKGAAERGDGRDSISSVATMNPAVNRPTRSKECAISFRLRDGSSLKHKFPSSAKLGVEVRKWLDENRTDGDQPYIFLHLLTPLPNKQISISEETSEDLQSLGLTPSATLVLVSTESYSTAYSASGSLPSSMASIITAPIGLLWGAMGAVTGAMSSVLGGGVGGDDGAGSEQGQGQSVGQASISSSSNTGQNNRSTTSTTRNSNSRSKRIHTLHGSNNSNDNVNPDRPAPARTNFYNGNQLSFEPNTGGDGDEEEDKKK